MLPVDPTLRATDWLRYCYRIRMRLEEGAPSVWGSWQPTDPELGFVTEPTSFYSWWFEDDKFNEGIGEQWPADWERGCGYPIPVPCCPTPCEPTAAVELEGGEMVGKRCEIPLGFCRELDGGEYEGGEVAASCDISFVGATNGTSTLGILSNVVPAGTVEHDVMLCLNTSSGGGAGMPPLPTGWTSVATGSDVPGAFYWRLSFKVASGAEPANYTVLVPGASVVVAFVATLRGASGAAPLGQGTIAINDALSAPSQDCECDNAMLLAFYVVNTTGGNAWTLPASMTLQLSSSPATGAGRLLSESVLRGATGPRIAGYGPLAVRHAAVSALVR